MSPVVFLVDDFFDVDDVVGACGALPHDEVIPVGTAVEPTTDQIDLHVAELNANLKHEPCAVVGVGGGITLDTAKAVSNLLRNPGKASDYQGWDLLRNFGVYKIGVPTIFGTGAEASRTCVLVNSDTRVKLGMNSDFSLFDEVVIDSSFASTVTPQQYFYTGMDTYLHCVESLAGRHRNPLSDAFSRSALELSREVFLGGQMQSPGNRSKLATASYLGGMAIAGSLVGVVHPLSAALSSILGVHHCEANCIAMRAVSNFYPDAADEFWAFASANGIEVGTINGAQLTDTELASLRAAMLAHERPLMNALGDGYRATLTDATLDDMFRAL